MQKDNVKKQMCLNLNQSEKVAILLKDFFHWISYEEIDEMLTDLTQKFNVKYPGLDPTDVSDKDFFIGKLSILLKELSEIKDQIQVNPLASKPSLNIQVEQLLVSFKMESDAMDDGKVGAIRKGDLLQCERIKLKDLEAGYNCAFKMSDNSLIVCNLISIDEAAECLIMSQLNPKNLTVYSFSEIEEVYLVLA